LNLGGGKIIDDKLVQISFSIQSGPGIYALLLGSGVSNSAGIKTGWEITNDLIRQIALAYDEPDQSNYEEWYYNKFGEEANYPNVINKLGKTNAERSNILAKYFEPTEDELVEGKKVPTAAHKAIADLVKLGYIKVIITTNFDQLIETALRENGIAPTIIDSDDSIIGATPYIHNKCTIIKVNGDYKDNRIKNTPDELMNYSSALNRYLDGVFDNFGLIICGWSGEWDISLKNSLIRRSNRRYSIYWTTRGELNSPALDLIQRINADVVKIRDADQLFSDLAQYIDSIVSLNKKNPSTISITIEETKKLLSEERYFIRLHDFASDVVEDAYTILTSDRFPVNSGQMSISEYQGRMKEYEELMKIPIGVNSTIAYFDRGINHKIVLNSLNRLLQIKQLDGYSTQVALQFYPSLLYFYCVSISSLESSNYNILYSMLYKSIYINHRGKQPAAEFLNYSIIFPNGSSKYVDLLNVERQKTPISDYLLIRINEYLSKQISSAQHLEELFDIFEYLYGLVYIDLKYDTIPEDRAWVPIGRYAWKYYDFSGSSDYNPIKDFFNRGEELSENWELIQNGFFKGSVSRYKECRIALENHIKKTDGAAFHRRWQ